MNKNQLPVGHVANSNIPEPLKSYFETNLEIHKKSQEILHETSADELKAHYDKIKTFLSNNKRNE